MSIYAAFLQPNSTVTNHRHCAHDCSGDEWIFETKKVPLKLEILKELKLIHDRKLFVTSPLWHKPIQSCRMSWKHWHLHTAVLNSCVFFWGRSNLSPIVSVLATVDFGLRSCVFMTEWLQCGVPFWCRLTAVCWWLQLCSAVLRWSDGFCHCWDEMRWK